MSYEAHRGGGVAALYKAKLPPSQQAKLCRMQRDATDLSQRIKQTVGPSPASDARINADFMQTMRTKMIKAFINSEAESKTNRDVAALPPPSLDRILLRRATLNSRKLHLFSGDKHPPLDTLNVWSDPILVTAPSFHYHSHHSTRNNRN